MKSVLPSQPSFGVNVKLPSSFCVITPSSGCSMLVTLIVSPSRSLSLSSRSSTVKFTGAPSSLTKESSSATGGSFSALTSIVAVAVSVSVPSLIV